MAGFALVCVASGCRFPRLCAAGYGPRAPLRPVAGEVHPANSRTENLDPDVALSRPLACFSITLILFHWLGDPNEARNARVRCMRALPKTSPGVPSSTIRPPSTNTTQSATSRAKRSEEHTSELQ